MIALDVLMDNIMWHLVGRSRLTSAVLSHWYLVRIFSFQEFYDHSIGFHILVLSACGSVYHKELDRFWITSERGLFTCNTCTYPSIQIRLSAEFRDQNVLLMLSRWQSVILSEHFRRHDWQGASSWYFARWFLICSAWDCARFLVHTHNIACKIWICEGGRPYQKFLK